MELYDVKESLVTPEKLFARDEHLLKCEEREKIINDSVRKWVAAL